MTKIKTFFRSFVKSIVSPDYYHHVVETKLSFSFKYFAFLHFVLAVIAAGVAGVSVSKFDVQTPLSKVANLYPEELVVTYNQAGLSINQDLPYTFGSAEEIVGLFDEQAEKEMMMDDDVAVDWSIVRFDSDENITSIQDVIAAQSAVVLTETTAYVRQSGERGEVRAYPIEKLENSELVLDKADVDTFFTKLGQKSIIRHKLYVPAIMLVVLVAAFVATMVARLIVVLVYSVVSKLAQMIFMGSKKLSYGKVFQISLHALTPVIVLRALDHYTHVTFFRGWMGFVIYLVWTLYVISKLDDVKPAKAKKARSK